VHRLEDQTNRGSQRNKTIQRVHSMDPPSLIQEALDEARARDIVTTVGHGRLFQPISGGQEEQAPETARERGTDTTAMNTTLWSTSAGHTSPALEGLQARVSSPTHVASSMQFHTRILLWSPRSPVVPPKNSCLLCKDGLRLGRPCQCN